MRKLEVRFWKEGELDVSEVWGFCINVIMKVYEGKRELVLVFRSGFVFVFGF